MADNQKIAQGVLAAVGGKENVNNALHCMTRLRFTLKDESVVNDDEVKAIDGVLGVQKKGGQYQVVIGTNVPEVYDAVVKMGVAAGGSVDEKVEEDVKKEVTAKGIGNAVLDYLSGSVVPLIPVLITGAFFQTLSSIFGPTMLNLVSAKSDFVFLCKMVFDAAFYFMPIMAGYTSAKKLNSNPLLGAFMGAILISPTFVALVGTKGASLSVYGIPSPVQSYAQTLIPVLLCNAVMAPVLRFFEKKLPNSIRTVFAPFFTFVVMMPVALCLLAPLGGYIGTGLAAFFEFLAGTPFGWIAVMLIAATWPLLVLTGMHVGIAAIALAQFAQTGSDSLVLMSVSVIAYTAAAVGLVAWIRFKDPEKKSLALGYFLTNFLGGVGEPLLYGIFIKYRRPWLATIIGGAAGGLYAAITGVKVYSGIQGLFTPLNFIGGSQANFVNGIISVVIATVVSFVVAWFWGFTKEQLEGKE